MSPVAWRLVLGPVLVGVVVGSAVLDAAAGTHWGTAGLITGLTLVAGWESARLFARTGGPTGERLGAPPVLVALAAAAPAAARAGAPDRPATALWIGAAALSLPVLSSLVYSWTRCGGAPLRTLGAVTLPAAVGLGLVEVRLVDPGGLGWLVLAVTAAKAGDICAWAGGRLTGRTPLAPSISPNKTVEGAAWAVVGAAAAGAIVAALTARPDLAWWGGAAAGAACGLLGILGDLTESLLKRRAGAKDSGALLPDFGGALDLVDSFVWLAPVLAVVLAVIGP